MTYQQCDQLLRGRCRNRRKIANNTYLNRDSEYLYITLHGHNIIEFTPDGTISYDTHGFNTRTTKDRMNRFGEANITQKRFTWYVHGIEVENTWKNTDLLSPEEQNLRMELTT